MSQLRSCYFCGAVGDSLQEYEVVPERLVSPGGSRSAVLCSTCHEKLRRVLEPLVDAAEATTEPSADSLDEVTFDAANDDAAATEPAAASDGEDAGAETASDESTVGDETETTADATSSSATDASATDDGDEEASDDDSADADEGAADAGDDLPDDYYKVLRLLQNREFPMERADLTALVTGAYDVSPAECERILETAIERGVLVEDGSTLDVGRN